MKKLPIVFQGEMADCGLACINMLTAYWGLEVDLSALKRRYDSTIEGLSIHSIMSTLSDLGITSRILWVEPEDLKNIEGPAILHWDLTHYVVLKRVTRRGIEIHDPNIGLVFIEHRHVGSHLSGYALECAPAANFQQGKFKRPRRVSDLWSEISGLFSAVGTASLLSLGLFASVLIAPFFMKYAIDNIVVAHDLQLLWLVAGVFLFAMVFSSMIRYLRDMTVLQIGNKISLQIGSNLLNHILKLPLSFFEKRKIGDLNARFSAIDRVRESMTDGFLVIVVDGSLAIIAIAVLLYYAPLLAVVSLVAFSCYLCLRLTTYHRIRQYHDESLIATGVEQAAFYETLAGIQAIKLFGRESERFGIWQNSYKESMDKRLKIGLFDSWLRSLNDFLYHTETIAMVSVGVFLIMNDKLSIGMLFVALTYKNVFSDRLRTCVDQIMRYRLLTVFLEHISDIIDHEHDSAHQNLPHPPVVESGTLFEARNISFSYTNREPVIRDASFSIKKGERIAFIGRSGEGKSTLIKLLLGLYYPQQGELTYGGVPLNQIDVRALRERIGVVMQNDKLLSGSVMENITFFDVTPDEAWAHECAKTAMIFNDIAEMPMGFDSLVGDMGSTLSGGQKQRLMIARALYRRPEILILDEGTANLDIETEAALLARLSQRGLTLISVAHRPETVRFSERLLSLHHGELKEVSISRLEQIRDEVFDSELLKRA